MCDRCHPGDDCARRLRSGCGCVRSKVRRFDKATPTAKCDVRDYVTREFLVERVKDSSGDAGRRGRAGPRAGRRPRRTHPREAAGKLRRLCCHATRNASPPTPSAVGQTGINIDDATFAELTKLAAETGCEQLSNL